MESPSSVVECSRHSIDAGESTTRRGATSSLGSVASPSASASSTPCSYGALDPLTASVSGCVARFTTSSPVSRTLRSVSFSPTDVNERIGGFAHATVKNECGARLPRPCASTVLIQAMGRGTTRAVISRYGSTPSSPTTSLVRRLTARGWRRR